MKFNTYTIIARLFPAVISAAPFFVLYYFLLSPLLGNFLTEFLSLKIASDVTIYLALTFVLIQSNRFISKEFFEKNIFQSRNTLPTTNFLLHLDSHFSPIYTEKIHAKIASDFEINIPTLSREAEDEAMSRKIIGEAMSHVRAKVGNGKLVGQHNAEYGFWRNLAGGSIVGFLVSVLNSLLFVIVVPNQVAMWVSIIMTGIFLFYLLFARKLIMLSGIEYAKTLLQEYMTK